VVAAEEGRGHAVAVDLDHGGDAAAEDQGRGAADQDQPGEAGRPRSAVRRSVVGVGVSAAKGVPHGGDRQITKQQVCAGSARQEVDEGRDILLDLRRLAKKPADPGEAAGAGGEAGGGGARGDAAEGDDVGPRIGGPAGQGGQARGVLGPLAGGAGGEDRGEQGVVDEVVAGLGLAVAGAAEQAGPRAGSFEGRAVGIAAQVEAGEVRRDEGRRVAAEQDGDAGGDAAAAQGGEAGVGGEELGGRAARVAEQGGRSCRRRRRRASDRRCPRGQVRSAAGSRAGGTGRSRDHSSRWTGWSRERGGRARERSLGSRGRTGHALAGVTR
jgi:hypothetical protein